jgi:putative ABC transport system permease protein
VTALDKKLFRDLWHIKGQALAIALVIASGVATFVMSLSALDSLTESRDRYYDRYRFAHVFASLKRAPNSVAERAAEIPGVANVQRRVVREVNLDVPGMDEPAIGRLISVPETHRPVLNDIHIRSGRYIEANRPGEVMVSEAFASAHGFQPGDSLVAIINGRRQDMKIVGVVLSPEYVLQVRSAGAWPDDKRFGVLWMSERELSVAFDMDGAFNDLSLTLMPGASEPDVIARVDRLLARYGGLGAYGRSDQVSNRFLMEELRGLRGTILIIPTIFFAVAAFLLNVVLSRMITLQRGEIGTLKAFGYTRYEAGLHFLKLAVLITIVGSAFGTGVGARLGRGLTAMYARFYRFPVYEFSIETGLMMLGFVVSCAAATVGVLGAARRAARLPPAEAMRAEPPSNYRATILERLGFQRWLSPSARMVLRNLERRPFKAAMSVLGIALATAILVVGSFNEDSISYMMRFQFRLAQQQDVTVGFYEAKPSAARHELTRLPGVIHAEAFRSVPVRMRSGHVTRRVGIMGMETDARLFRLLDENERVVRLPDDGLVLSDKLARILQVQPGDVVSVEILEGDRSAREVPVRSVVREYSGVAAYMSLPAVNRLMKEGRNMNGAHLMVDVLAQEKLYRRLKTAPQVASVTVKEAALKSFNDTVAENLLQMRIFNIIFAVIIAFGVVYNSARISLSERSRELATLRVIGFRRAEISLVLLGELGVLTAAAIPVGLLMGFGLSAWVSRAFDTELYRIPLVVESSTYAFAVTLVLGAAAISGMVVRRRLDHLDLIGVLKTRE